MDTIQRAYEHIQYLSETIGGRGSCTTNERRAAEYARQKLLDAGALEVGFEPFNGSPSTYLPFVLAFSCALVGTLFALLAGYQVALFVGAVLNLLGVWAMLAESEFSSNWTRWFLPKAKTQNVTAVIQPRGTPEGQVVLCAHLDTHRTPIFFSSQAWLKVFNLLVTGTVPSMALGALLFGLGGIFGLIWVRWAGLLFGALQLFSLVLVISAEFTPFSPGANDNASGAGITLALAERIREQPLKRTTVNFLFTDCEETGAYGSIAYLKQHASKLGNETVYIILDEVGAGHVKTVSADGLIIKHKTHPRALQLARRATGGMVHPMIESPGSAYTDALPATKRGLIAIVAADAFPAQGSAVSHWHQMSDRLEFIDRQTLQDTLTFIWNILQEIDQAALG